MSYVAASALTDVRHTMRSDLMRLFAEPVILMVWSSLLAFRKADDAINEARTIANDTARAERN